MQSSRRSEKYDAILDAAMQEFLEHGYTGTSLDRISSLAGVSKATVHSYFQYKENLFKALVERIAERKIRMIFGESLILEGSPDQALRGLATKFLTSAANDREFLQFIRLLIGESGRFPELTKLFERSLHERAFGILNHYFSQQQDLPSKNIKALTYFFMGNLISYILLQEIMYAKEINPILQEEFIEGLMEVMSAKKSV